MLFRFQGLSAHFSTLFCANLFKEKAEGVGLKGLEFIPLETSCSEDVEPL